MCHQSGVRSWIISFFGEKLIIQDLTPLYSDPALFLGRRQIRRTALGFLRSPGLAHPNLPPAKPAFLPAQIDGMFHTQFFGT